MTQAISIAAVLGSFGGALEYTGMAASNSTFYAVSPSGGTLDEANETVTSNGQFWATLNSNTSTNNHLFRSPGVAPDEYADGTSGVTDWAGNPDRILVDTATFGSTPVTSPSVRASPARCRRTERPETQRSCFQRWSRAYECVRHADATRITRELTFHSRHLRLSCRDEQS